MHYHLNENCDKFIILNLDELQHEYTEYRVSVLLQDEYFAFGEFCMMEHHKAMKWNYRKTSYLLST